MEVEPEVRGLESLPDALLAPHGGGVAVISDRIEVRRFWLRALVARFRHNYAQVWLAHAATVHHVVEALPCCGLLAVDRLAASGPEVQLPYRVRGERQLIVADCDTPAMLRSVLAVRQRGQRVCRLSVIVALPRVEHLCGGLSAVVWCMDGALARGALERTIGTLRLLGVSTAGVDGQLRAIAGCAGRDAATPLDALVVWLAADWNPTLFSLQHFSPRGGGPPRPRWLGFVAPPELAPEAVPRCVFCRTECQLVLGEVLAPLLVPALVPLVAAYLRCPLPHQQCTFPN